MKWLAECSAAALDEALRVVAPELSGGPVTVPVPDPAVKGDPLWWSSSAVVCELGVAQLLPATTQTLRERFGRWARPDQRRIIMRWCDWCDAVLASPGPAVLVHGDLHGNNQVWDRGKLRLVVDFETAGAAEPEYDLRLFPGPDMGPGVELLTSVMRHYQKITGRYLSTDRVMAWHLRTALDDALWRSEAGIPLTDHRTPPERVDDLAARFTMLGIDPEAPRPLR